MGDHMIYSFLLFCVLLCVSSLHHGKSSSTGNLLEREDMALPVPDYGIHSRMAAQSAAALHGRQQRPYSVAVPGFSQVGGLQNKHTNTCKLSSTHMGSHITHEQSHETWQRSRLSQKVWRQLPPTCCQPEMLRFDSLSLSLHKRTNQLCLASHSWSQRVECKMRHSSDCRGLPLSLKEVLLTGIS